jgi:hypothetical protein
MTHHLRHLEIQGALALDLSHALPDEPVTPELVAVVDDDAEVRAWAARMAQAVVEVVCGRRPVCQLVRWTAPEVYRDLERRVAVVRRAGGTDRRPVPPQVRSVHVCRVRSEAAEVSVHIRHGLRSRALALRLERRAGRWQCTVLQFG